MSVARRRIGPYRVSELIGEGGMGSVFRAQHPTGVEVAIKVLKVGGGLEPVRRERFRRELSALQRLRHDNVLSVIDAGEDSDGGGSPWLAMPFIRGESLESRLAYGGGLPLDEVIDLGRQLAGALAHVHDAGLLHRDLKPANVLSHSEGGLTRWLLTDFGLVKDLASAESEALSRSGMLLGTPGYWSPEQAQGQEVSPATDVYGLGAILYAALAGTPPLAASESLWEAVVAVTSQTPRPLRELRPEIPRQLEALVLRCLAKDPLGRFADGGALVEALAHVSLRPPRTSMGTGSRVLVLVGALALGGAMAGGALISVDEARGPVEASPPSEAPGSPGPVAASSLAAALAPSPPSGPSPVFDLPAGSVAGPESASVTGLLDQRVKRFAELKTRATRGDLEAIVALAHSAAIGIDVDQDVERATRLYALAAKKGDLEAYSHLAGHLFRQRGPDVDEAANRVRAFEALQVAANKGSARALRGLGHFYMEGIAPAKQDFARGLECYREGGRLGDAMSYFALARFHAGRGEEKEAALVNRLVHESARPDEGMWQFAAGVLALHGYGQAVDKPTSERRFKRAAELGFVDALRIRATLLMRKGASVAEGQLGIRLALRACRLGDSKLMGRLSRVHLRGEFGQVADRKAALSWARRGALLGDPRSMEAWARSLLSTGLPEDRFGEGVYWALTAARDGRVEAASLVAAVHYSKTPPDYAFAVKWFRWASERGDDDGSHGLAFAMFEGKGVPQDRARAVKRLRELAANRHFRSMSTLGNLYRLGLGVPQNLDLARAHLHVAAREKVIAAYVPLAIMCLRGQGGEVDVSLAKKLIEVAERYDQQGTRAARRELNTLLGK